MPARQLLMGSHPVPDLVSVDANDSGGNSCTASNWIVTVSWVLTNPNDTEYQIDVTGIAGAAGSTTGLLTSAGSWIDDTGFQGNTQNPPFTEVQTAQYRVKLVRKSDSSIVEQIDTNTVTLNYSLELCT